MADSASHPQDQPFVFETRTKKKLYFSLHEVQSSMDLRQPDALDLEYTRMMMGFLLFQPEPRSIAMVGLGGGSLAKFCHRHLPGAHIRVVEINPQVIALRDEFKVPPDSERFSVIQADGADFMRFSPGRFNVLLIDGYAGEGLPGQLASQQFYDECFDSLLPEGIMVVNLLADLADYVQILGRIERSFNGRPALAVPVGDRTQGNRIVFAKKGRSMGALRMGPLRRPVTLDEPAWKPLQASFAGILSALKGHGS